MEIEFPLSLHLVREDDGELTLLAAIVTPSQSFRATAPLFAAPSGVVAPPHSFPIVLPLVSIGTPILPTPAVVHHTVSNISLDSSQTRIAVFVTLGGVVVGRGIAELADVVAIDFAITVEAAAPVDSAAIQPDQTELTIVQAGVIVQEAVPGPDVPFSTKLENAVGVSPARLSLFQEAVFAGVNDRGFRMKKTDIPKSGSTKLAEVRTSVQQNARRMA
jgi:hypothetical protein